MGCLTCLSNCKNNKCLCYLACVCCKEIKFCPDNRVFLKCCNICELTYWVVGFIQTFFTLGLYYFDIGSDILVLVDLKKTNSEYFNLCLVILLLPTFYALTRYNNVSRGIEKFVIKKFDKCSKIPKILSCLLLHFLFNVLQFNVIFSSCIAAKYSTGIDTKGFQLQYVDIRMIESLLESSPQSLFQLFLVLKSAAEYSYNQIIIYYLSISLSIFSLVFSLVSYEVIYYNNKRIKYLVENFLTSSPVLYKVPLPESVSKKIFEDKVFKSIPEKDETFDIRYKFLVKNTPYVGLLFFYRLTEVLSRIGLLAVIGNIYNGYFIIIFLLCDFLLLTIANIYKIILKPRSCESSCITTLIKFKKESKHKKNIAASYKCRKVLKILYELFFTLEGIISIITFLISQLKNLGVFSHYFSYYMYNETYLFLEKDKLNLSLPMNRVKIKNKQIKDRRQKAFKIEFMSHFISRYLNNLCLSILIIYNLTINTHSQSLYLISISSIICFVLNIIFLALVTLYTRNYLKYSFMFKPILCGKSCHCCKNTHEESDVNDQLTNQIKKKIANRVIESRQVYPMNPTYQEKSKYFDENKKSNIEDKHPDDIII